MKWIVPVLLLLVLLVAAIPYPVLAAGDDSVALSYPVLDSKLAYYETTFPSGLRYSPGWYGTFSYAPAAAEILLFDDDWSEDFGICIFSMKPGIVPSGEQGGTRLMAITRKQADITITAYPLEASVKPFDKEITDVMVFDHFFTGVWAGNKLQQKWLYGSTSINGPPKTGKQKQYLAEAAGDVKQVDLSKYDPDRYWVNGTGSWSDTAHWSDTSGNITGGASVPTNADNVYFDLNSFTAGGQVVTIDVVANCLDMDWTGATNTPTFAGSAALNIYGSCTYIAAMNIIYTGAIAYRPAVATTKVLTSNGAISLSSTTINGLGTLQLADQVTLAGIANLTLTAGTFDSNGQEVALAGTAHTIDGNFTFAFLTRAGTATKTDSITFTSSKTVTVTDICNLVGDNITNRMLVQSSVPGTAATLTVGTGNLSASNADFMDITVTNAADLSAIAGLSGNCGGNTGITFTPALAQAWDTTTGSWSNAAKWISRVPLPQDDVSVGGAGNAVTVDMPRIGKSTTFTGTPIVSLSNNIDIYGSLTLASGVTYTHNNRFQYFRGRGAYTLTSSGKTLYQIYMYAPSGTLTLQDNLAVTAKAAVYYGTLDFNNKNVTAGYFEGGSNIDADRTLTTGSGNFTLNGTVATDKWGMDIYYPARFTLNAGTSTIILTNSSANAQSFVGLGKTYNNVTVEGTGNYALTVTGDNTFNIVTVDGSLAAKTIVATGTTQTVNNFKREATPGINVVTLTNGTWTSAEAVTDIELEYMSISGSTATPINTWYAGDTPPSVDGGGNAGWIFTRAAIPSVTTNLATLITMDKDGVTGGTFNGSIATINGTPTLNRWFEYGLTAAYGSTTANVTAYVTGAYTAAVPVGLTPGATYHYRADATNTVGSMDGLDQQFTFTMPTVSTTTNTVVPSSVTVRGTVPTFGVASSAYVRFAYGTTPALGQTTALQTVAGAGAFSASVAPPTTSTVLYYRADIIVGATTVSGAVSTASIPAATGGHLLSTILTIILAAVILVGVAVAFLTLGMMPGLIATAIGIVGFAIISALLATI